jgi:BirA family biotin operon repressor/biotin-[acetyl-CoA-carboxylase] ligase
MWELVNEYVQNVRIKWPNDIYVNNDKIAGILIENSFVGNQFEYSVIGAGLNVNQKCFPENILNPTSLYRLTGIEHELKEILRKLIYYMNHYYDLLLNRNYTKINEKYLSHLYRFNELHSFKTKNEIIKGRITGVGESGHLEITSNTDEIFRFDFKEIEFLQASVAPGKS